MNGDLVGHQGRKAFLYRHFSSFVPYAQNYGGQAGRTPFTSVPGLNPGLSPPVPSSFVILNYGGQVGTKTDLRAPVRTIEATPLRAAGFEDEDESS